MITKKEINVPIYGGILTILITDRNVYVKDHYDDLGADNEITYAHTVRINTTKESKSIRAYLTAFHIKNEYAKITHGVIAHEAFHAADMILAYHGLELTDSSCEAYAYLLQWITNEIYKVFIKKNIEIYIKA